jgi:ABC-2 type transport system ATP-binding protein
VSISISNLSKQYGQQKVLNNVSFDIDGAEVVGFLGPNGAGKTTTMRIIAGALSYQSGSVKVCGMEVNENTLQTNALIGYLPEQNPLYPDMYVKEYLFFVAETHGIKKGKEELVDSLIDKVGLRPEFHKKIGQLSKGYRQRVGLAQALVSDPKVLILDEPTTGLDPNQLEEIRQLIRELGKDRTVILSTHIMQEIKHICNRVLIINQGEIVADYPDISKINLFDEGQMLFEVEFLYPIDIDELRELESIISVTAISKNSLSIVAKEDIRTKIFDFCVQTNNKILLIKPVERSMEELFRDLTVI